jgi:hypothetical protein
MQVHAFPLDPRDNQVKQDSIRRSRQAMYQERGDLIREAARRYGATAAVQMIRDIYGPDASQIMDEMDRLCEQFGYATISRIQQAIARRGQA